VEAEQCKKTSIPLVEIETETKQSNSSPNTGATSPLSTPPHPTTTTPPNQINLLDTPGHQDFSEDTYRTLAAADNAVMLVDGAKGIEEQTRKLFAVARLRGLPIFTVRGRAGVALGSHWGRIGVSG